MKSLSLALLFVWLGCKEPTYEVVLNLEPFTAREGPVLSSVQIIGGAAGDEPLELEAALGFSLPVDVGIEIPARLATEVLSFDVVGFIGGQEVFRSGFRLDPGQKNAALIVSPCSDHTVAEPETCDDGNLTNEDGCDQNCTPTGCENGIPINGELCFAKNDDLVGPGIPEQARSADFDDDGTPDLVVRYEEDPANPQPRPVRVFLNQAAGRFGSFVDLPLEKNALQFATGDVNNDGLADVVVLQGAPLEVPQVVVFLNQGGGRFFRDNGALLALDETAALELADLDANGTLELITADAALGIVRVRKGSGTGSFSFLPSQSVSLPTGARPLALVVAEVDDTPGLDLVSLNVADKKEDRVTLLLNDGAGLLSSQPGPAPALQPSALVLAQLDDQPGLDLGLAISSGFAGTNGIQTFTNDREGNFVEVGTFLVNGSLTALTTADFDGDQDQDLAVTDFQGAQVQILVNNGAGQFDTPEKLETGIGLLDTKKNPISLFSAEFNGDGVADLVVTGKNIGLLFSNP